MSLALGKHALIITLERVLRISDEMRKLTKKWESHAGWPKRLEWIEVSGLRGWAGQRVSFPYPIVAIVGENGSGKSTLLQAAASVYRGESTNKTLFPSEFFPSTAWDNVKEVVIKYGYQQGSDHKDGSVRKPTTRWLGHSDRPQRQVEYIDLSRLQPVATRVGYARIAKTKHTEKSSVSFDDVQVKRFSSVMGKQYQSARMALADIDETREVPVVSKGGASYSGFHQGSGEITVAELMRVQLPKYGLVLIDEIESSLHPRAQRRLIRDLAEMCRDYEVQIILTTHSPYILEELPLQARMQIVEIGGVKTMVPGVSPQFSMTQMDDEGHPECDLYVEDEAAKVMLGEILARHGGEMLVRCSITPCGAASVGQALGQMVHHKRFARPTCVFLDGDSAVALGCTLLPGDDAPEQVIFKALRTRSWANVWSRIGRDTTLVDDACNRAMTLGDHHNWVTHAANELKCGSQPLWQAMCAEWASICLSPVEVKAILDPIENVLT